MVNYSTLVINSQSFDNFTDFVKNLNKTTYSSIFIETKRNAFGSVLRAILEYRFNQTLIIYYFIKK